MTRSGSRPRATTSFVLTDTQLVQLANALGWTREQVCTQLAAHYGRNAGGIEEGERLSELLGQSVRSAAGDSKELPLRRKGLSLEQRPPGRPTTSRRARTSSRRGRSGSRQGDNIVLTDTQLVQLANALEWTREEVCMQLRSHYGRIASGKCGALCCVCAHRAIPVCVRPVRD
jgi:hypothetical protein